MMARSIRAAAVICLIAASSGCAGQPASSVSDQSIAGAGQPEETAVHRAIGQCIVSVGIGAIGGAILAAALGHNAGGGAAIGTAAAVGACAVLMQVAAQEDQMRIAQLGQQAVASNTSGSQSFTTTKGQTAVVTTVVTPASPPQKAPGQMAAATAKFTDCRYASQAVQVGGQSASVDKQLWCRLQTGDWKEVS
jgi:hypothetical protein